MNEFLLLSSGGKTPVPDIATFTKMGLIGNMPNLVEATVELAGGKIFAWGSTSGGNNNVIIDTTSWSIGTFSGLFDSQGAVISAKDKSIPEFLVSFGNNGGVVRTFVRKINLQTNSNLALSQPLWSSKDSAYCNTPDNFYIMGGVAQAEMRIYNYATDKWSYNTLTANTVSGAAGMISGSRKLYLHGGTSASNSDSLYSFDIDTKVLTSLGNTTFKRMRSSQLRECKGKLFMFGGEDELGRPTKTLLMLDPDTDTLIEVGKVPETVPALKDCRLVADSENLYLLAGSNINNGYNLELWKITINL